MMKIGPILLNNPTVFAPLAGITNLPLRLMAKAAGCALVYSEMVSAYGLVYRSEKTRLLLDSAPEEKPLSVQIFGSDATIVAEAAQIAAATSADIVDINFGCSVKKILKSGAGAALMREPEKAKILLKAVRKAIDIPLTIKIRSGWDASGNQALDIARIAQECGVDAVALHPRTVHQGFRGHADWSLIGKVKQNLQIPVIGNGDIMTPEDALRMKTQTGCDGLMVGRAAIGSPYLFTQIIDLLNDRTPCSISIADRIKLMRQYLCTSVQYLGEKRACYMLRSRLGWFAKGLPHAAQFRQAIRFLASEEQGYQHIRDFIALLEHGADEKETPI